MRRASAIRTRKASSTLCHTTSWGVSTRLIGGVIMTHGDDDGLRVPPAIAPQQIVILPMLRDDDGDAALLAYCEDLRRALAAQTALGEPVRVLLDKRAGKATQKRWDWVKKGVPLILEIGGRDAAGGQVSVLRRDRLWRDRRQGQFHRPGARTSSSAPRPLRTRRHPAIALHEEARPDAMPRSSRGQRLSPTWKRSLPRQALSRLGRTGLVAADRRCARSGRAQAQGAQADHPQHADGRCAGDRARASFTGEPAVRAQSYVARAY